MTYCIRSDRLLRMRRVFTKQDEYEVLKYYRDGTWTHRTLGAAYGVNQATITRALARAIDEERKAKRRARDAKRKG